VPSATTAASLNKGRVRHSQPTELIADRVWRSHAQVEVATVQWVAWFNHDRLHESLGDIPPVELEQLAAASTLNASIPVNGSVGGSSRRPQTGSGRAAP